MQLRNASHSASPVPLGTRERMYIHNREISKSKVPLGGAPTAWLWVAFSTPPQNPPPICTSRLPSERLCHAILDLLSARACGTAFPLLIHRYVQAFLALWKPLLSGCACCYKNRTFIILARAICMNAPSVF